MSAFSRIVSGGGWKEIRSKRVKVKAWAGIVVAVALAGVSLAVSERVWVTGATFLAGLSLLTSIVLFIREKPKEVQFPWGPSGHDPRNLYGARGPAAHLNDRKDDEPPANQTRR